MTMDSQTPRAGILAYVLSLVPKSLTLTGNPALDSLIFKVIVGAASIGGTWLYTKLNLHDPDYARVLTGVILTVLVGAATMVWGWLNSKLNQAKAVNAGINLFAAGQSINLALGGTGVVTPKRVTPMSAPDIVRNFGDVHVEIPNEPALTAELNQTQIVRDTKKP